MRTLVRGSMALAFAMLVVSCSGLLKKKAPADAGPEASALPEAVVADAAPPPVSAPLAANEGDIARFPDETKLADVAATLQRASNVREAPPAGAIVTGLSKGTNVTQVAQRGTSFLVVFDDPKTPGAKMMGWVHRDAFSTVVQDAGPLVCPKGEIALYGDTPFCGKLCSADSECPTGQACKGQANKLLPSGKAGDGVTVCTVFHPHDAGAPVVDAGSSKVIAIDAGLARIDAGPPAAPTSDVVPAVGGKCPANFVFVAKTNKCHRPCPGGPTKGECKNAKPFCIKCDKDEKKVCAEAQDQCR